VQQLRVKRLRFSKEADTWLRVMKSRTDITPNLLCRIGFCMSLEEPGVPDPAKYPEDSDREINRYTLLGEYDAVFVSLLRQRLARDANAGTSLDDQFRAHMNRGVVILSGRLKELSDLAGTCPGDGKDALVDSEPPRRSRRRAARA
jgi:DNA sulfur modification protein DndE